MRELAAMSAQRGENGRVRIDLIDVDPEVFNDDGSAPAARGRPRLLTILALMVVVAVAATLWWPSGSGHDWRVYASAPVPVAGLTDELVFDNPPGLVVVADLPPPPTAAKPEVGYVFGEPDGTFLSRSWAMFRTGNAASQDTPPSTDLPQVNGVTAEVRRLRLRRTVSWRPLDGRQWVVTTNQLNETQAIEFANNVAVIDGRPALSLRYELGEMQPVGSVAAFDCIVNLKNLFLGTRNKIATQPTVVTWAWPDGRLSLGSIAAPRDALPLVEFVLGAGRAASVHGLPAVAIESPTLGPLVAWIEDGRLIIVAGDVPGSDPSTTLLDLAESVRPASPSEWQQVARVDAGS